MPVDIVREICNDVLTQEGRGLEALQYGNARGVKDLREAIVDILLKPKGLDVTAEQLVITAGGIEAVYLVCAMLLNPGDVILVESPSFFHCVMSFEMFEAKCIACETDENGLVMEDVEAKIQEYHPKMIYTIPTFQNPTGITMSEGGLYTWVTLPEGYNTTEILQKSMETCKIIFVAGETCFVEGNGKGSRCMRLNFASAYPETIQSGIQKLGELICSMAK